MKNFDEIGKRMPYSEKTEYVQSMIDAKIEKVFESQSSKIRSVFIRRIAICTASAAALIGMVYLANLVPLSSSDALMDKVSSSRSLDEVLASLDDTQIETLADYSLEDIPEYNIDDYSE